MPASLKLPKIIDVTIERAYEIIEEMAVSSSHETNPMKIVAGKHPEYGAIYVSIPPLGEANILPIVVQQFD